MNLTGLYLAHPALNALTFVHTHMVKRYSLDKNIKYVTQIG